MTIAALCQEAETFARTESKFPEPSLFGVTDGKAVGTYFEHKFKAYLYSRYEFVEGSSANGIDFPELLVDMKVTSVRQPQSSCPFKSPRQKIYGLGYGLLVFVYEKSDDEASRSATLRILHTVFVDADRTADFQMTRGLLEILAHGGNIEELMAFMLDRNLPIDDIAAQQLAAEIIASPPLQGFLTISNALQWRLQYSRAIAVAGAAEGVRRIV